MGKKEMLLIDELSQKGYNFSGIMDLIKQSNPLPSEVIDIILKWLPEVYEEHLGSGVCLVRALANAGEPFDPTSLIDLFENSTLNDTVKCGIALVLSTAKTYEISDWLKVQLLTEEHSFKRVGLLHGIVSKAGFRTKNELQFFLMEIFDKYRFYEIFLKLFQKYGSIEHVYFLEQKAYLEVNKHTSKEILRVADIINNRKRIAKFP